MCRRGKRVGTELEEAVESVAVSVEGLSKTIGVCGGIDCAKAEKAKA